MSRDDRIEAFVVRDPFVLACTGLIVSLGSLESWVSSHPESARVPGTHFDASDLSSRVLLCLGLLSFQRTLRTLVPTSTELDEPVLGAVHGDVFR